MRSLIVFLAGLAAAHASANPSPQDMKICAQEYVQTRSYNLGRPSETPKTKKLTLYVQHRRRLRRAVRSPIQKLPSDGLDLHVRDDDQQADVLQQLHGVERATAGAEPGAAVLQCSSAVSASYLLRLQILQVDADQWHDRLRSASIEAAASTRSQQDLAVASAASSAASAVGSAAASATSAIGSAIGSAISSAVQSRSMAGSRTSTGSHGSVSETTGAAAGSETGSAAVGLGEQLGLSAGAVAALLVGVGGLL